MSEYFVDKSGCKAQEIFPGITIKTAAAEKMMLSWVDCQPGAIVQLHYHHHEQVGVVIGGRARFIIGDEQRVLEPGDLYRIPGGVPHKVIALDDGAQALDIFYPIREDYLTS